MDPLMPKAVWGFNGTERPGAVYLAAVLAAHNQKGLPAFGIYGRDVQDAGDTAIPEDVQEKLLRFAAAGLAVAIMRGKSLPLPGRRLDGHRRLDRRPDLLREATSACASKCVDMSEFIRRIEERIYDPANSSAPWPGRRQELQGRQGLTTPPTSSAARGRRTGTGRPWSRWP